MNCDNLINSIRVAELIGPDTISESISRSGSTKHNFLLRCIEGDYKGKFVHLSDVLNGTIIGSSQESRDVTFCIKADGVADVHCKLLFDSSDGRCELTNLSQTSTTWVKQLGGNLFDWTLVESESYLLRPNDQFRLGVSVVFELLRFNSGLAFAQGVRPSMEDEEVLIDDLGGLGISWYACYDGHGGAECALFLKERLHVNFVAKFKAKQPACITASLLAAFAQTESEFSTLVVKTGLSPNVGAVVNVVLISQTDIYCANLGDARAIYVSDESVTALSVDHKPESEIARIKSCGGTVVNGRVNGRLAVSRAIGDFEFKTSPPIVCPIPDIRVRPLLDDARRCPFLVIACDGLFDVLSSGEVASFALRRIDSFLKRNEHPDPKQIAIDLVTEAVMKRNSRDNVSVIVVLL